MIYEKSVIKIANNIVKFIAVTLLCFFCILVSRHYYQVKNYATTLYENLNVVIFFNENSSKEDMNTIEEIKATNLVFIKEYVNASEAYSRAIKKNPFLKDISISNDIKSSIQAYAIATFRSIPKKKLMLDMKKTLEKISGVDEVVFDMPIFEQYLKTENLLSFHKKNFLIFGITVFVLFTFKCIFFIILYKLKIKRFIIDIFLHLSCSMFAFLIFWIICTYMHYPLLVNEITLLSVIPFVAALGIILN
ncbi:MAG: hypothetical protein Nk1A_1000 [Endomicrobiia bacterium]|nr:MAG: hypothetical protein Nk1A_1000 [Endomicrobiia bacterium]